MIVGNGMIATAFKKHIKSSGDVIFASGVSDSSCTIKSEYNREIKLLQQTIGNCLFNKKRIIYFSSAGEIYGDCLEAKSENSLPNPITEYGHHKADCEKEIVNSGVDYLILRLPNAVGFNQNKKQLIPFLVNRAIHGKVELQQDATRDLLGVDDLAQLTVNLANSVKNNEIINLASGISIAVTDIFNEIENILDVKAYVKLVNGGVKHNFSIDKLTELLNISFQVDYWIQTLTKYVSPVSLNFYKKYC